MIADAPRPVPLAYEYVEMPLEGTVELALRKGEAPLYLVHFSQDAALATAQALSSYGVASKEQREQVKEAVKGTRFTTAFGKTLKRLLASGVGVHHAGMLPRYRLLVEKLAQQGLLPVICGTDTLGVGINVPIHTVVLTALTKFDGRKMRRLRAREFHQIVGRAGRSGFDTEGMVVALAPEHDIENAKLVAKAGDDPKKLRKIKKKQPPEGFVTWNRQTFERLIEAVPETLKPRLRITHSMVLSEVVQGGDAYARTRKLVADSAQTDEEKAALSRARRRDLPDAHRCGRGGAFGGRGRRGSVRDHRGRAGGFRARPAACRRFCWRRSSFWIPRTKATRSTSSRLAEATLEDPRQVLRAQERAARDKAMAEMKADGVDYDERLERLAEVTYPRPLGGSAGSRVRTLLPGGAVGARLRAVAEVGACATWWRRRVGLQDLRAALQASRARRERFCATWPTRAACSTARCPSDTPRRAAGGHRRRGSASSCARWIRAWWTSGRARVR